MNDIEESDRYPAFVMYMAPPSIRSEPKFLIVIFPAVKDAGS
jgi:hypothetical protein